MTDPAPSFESASVAAILAQRSREDQTELLEDLVALLAEVVPGARVERALIRRHVTALRLPLGEYVYLLKRASRNDFEASRLREVRGVVIRTDPMEIDLFLPELAQALDVELQRTERGRAALRAWLDSTNA